MAKKYVPTADELANDPTIRWTPYRRNELVWSDEHECHVRFLEYVGTDQARIATQNEIAPYPDTTPRLRIRRT